MRRVSFEGEILRTIILRCEVTVMYQATLSIDEKGRKNLRSTIFVIAFFHMSAVCITPALSAISQAFPETSVFMIQMCTASCSFMLVLFSAFSGTISAAFSRRIMISTGFGLMALAGICGFLFSFSSIMILLWSSMLGIGMGLFVSATSSLVIDCFNPDDQAEIAGTQNCIVNVGGVFFSMAGGLRVSLRWNAGYLCYLLCIPVALLARKNVPREKPTVKTLTSSRGKGRFALPKTVCCYGANVILFSIVYSAFNSNISLLLAERAITPVGTWAGICVATFMCGGAVSGLLFGQLSKRFGNFLFVLALLALAGGYAIVYFAPNVFVIMIGALLAGTSLSLVIPQSLISVAALVTQEQSVTASSLIMGIGPQIGGVISPIVFTRLSIAMGFSSVMFRYRFAGTASLLLAVVIFLIFSLNFGS